MDPARASTLQRAVMKYGVERVMAGLGPDERERLQFLWPIWARPDQLPPQGKWRVWLMLSGRGAGKTRSAAEYIRDEVEAGRAGSIHLVGETAADVRDTMVELGPSCLMKISRPDFRPRYEPSKRRLIWPNGAFASCFSAEDPDQLRGPQCDLAWADEVASWKNQRATWDMLEFGLRLSGPKGDRPRVVVSSTPQPNDVILELSRGLLQPDRSRRPRRDVVVGAKASTYDNQANLDAAFFESMTDRYEGTRVGRQELYAEILEDVEGALWSQQLIDEHRAAADYDPELSVVVIGVDPQGSTEPRADGSPSETGIVGVGLGTDGDIYVTADRSGSLKPAQWGARTIALYHELEADRVVPEKNNGGDMVRYTLKSCDPDGVVPVKPVWAARGKATRAEPVSALYEQGRVHHVGSFPLLEDQLCTWVPGGPSPDRLDALVWAISDLAFGRRHKRRVVAPRTVRMQ